LEPWFQSETTGEREMIPPVVAVVFNGPWTDKALIRNPLAFELGRTIGIQAPRTKHFEMFLSTNGGTLSANEYVGVYILLEKIKDDRNRTDLTNLEPTDNTEPEVSGGYLMRFEPPGIANDGPRATSWNSVEILDPPSPTTAQRNWIGNYLDQFAIDSLADPLAESAVRNFTMWDTLDDGSVGFPTPATNTWDEQILFMKDWLTQRTTWIDGQFSNLVTIALGSQAVSAGAQVALNAVGGQSTIPSMGAIPGSRVADSIPPPSPPAEAAILPSPSFRPLPTMSRPCGQVPPPPEPPPGRQPHRIRQRSRRHSCLEPICHRRSP
jgi:hypothetical protein